MACYSFLTDKQMKALHKEKKERTIPKQQRKQECERIYIFYELQVSFLKYSICLYPP